MPGRKIVDEADARSLLDAWAVSKLSLSNFARVKRVDGRSLQCWKFNFERRAQSCNTDSVSFVELVADAAVEPRPYRLRVGDVVIELPSNFEDGAVLRLLDLVRAC